MILFGGTFDPIHRGHLDAAVYVRDLFAQPVHLLLAPRPRLRSPCIASFEHRWTMLQLACQSFELLIPVDIERNVSGPTRTINTLKHLRRKTNDNFVWLLGSDALAKVHLWYGSRVLPEWLSFVVLNRPSFPVVQPPADFDLTQDVSAVLEKPGLVYVAPRQMLDLSATKVRESLQSGRGINHLVTTPVYEYIISRHIYEPKDSC